MTILNDLNTIISEDDDSPIVDNPESIGVKVYFNNLDEKTQQSIMEGLRATDVLNFDETDKLQTTKVTDALAKTPIFIVMPEELARILNIK